MVKATWLLFGILAVSLVWHGEAGAQSDTLERMMKPLTERD